MRKVMVKIVECPRDAMQGIENFIPTTTKTHYINTLLKVGFDTIDFGSFVSPRAVPQLRDTKEVLRGLDMTETRTKLLAIIANRRGADEAVEFDEITYLGYPFSLSETFQQRNTNRSRAEAFFDVEYIANRCAQRNKELVVYLSMGFGNPYGEEWNVEVAEQWTRRFAECDIKTISLADTVGSADPPSIDYLFRNLIPEYPNVRFGAHFHSHPDKRREKIEAAYQAGCRRFDAAIKGFGGCPFAEDELVGNIATEFLIDYFRELDEPTDLNPDLLPDVLQQAQTVFA